MQKLRFTYWVSEKQLRICVKKAFEQPGISGENILKLLERRLDNLVYRFGFAPTVLAARQMVTHGHISVNGRKVDRPSYSVKKGDAISVKGKSREILPVQEGIVRSQTRPALSYFEVDKKELRGTFLSIPLRSQIPLNINESLVVAYFARLI